MPASAAIVTKFGTDVSFTYDDSTLYGDGTVVGNTIRFNPTTFKAEVIGTGGDFLNAVLNVTITSTTSGFFLDKVDVLENGDYFLKEAGSEVNAFLFTQASSNTSVQTSNIVTDETGDLSSAGPTIFDLWNLSVTNDWS